MNKKSLSHVVKNEVSFGSKSQILHDLENHVSSRVVSGLIDAGYFSITDLVHGDTIYKIPVVHIPDFEGFFDEEVRDRDNHGRVKRLNKEVDSRREFVGLYKGLIIKSPKKGVVHPFEAEFGSNDKFALEEKAQLEYVNSNMLSRVLKKDVVRSLVVIESLAKGGLAKGKFYSAELYFDPLGNPSSSPAKQEAYENFLRYNKDRGFEYVPSNRDHPFEDLVVRRKNGGALEVLATDWPNFVKLK